MRYSEFKKVAAGNTSQVRPGSTSMNFPSPMGPKKEAPMRKLPIAQDEVRVGYNDPAALRVAQAQTPLLAQTMPGQQQPKPGFQFDYNKDLHNARQNAANQLQQMRRDTAAGKQVDTTGLTPTQYRYVASGAKGSGYNVQDTDESIQNAIYNPDPKDEQWRQQQRKDVVDNLRARQEGTAGGTINREGKAWWNNNPITRFFADPDIWGEELSGQNAITRPEILSEKQLEGLTPEERAYVNETRDKGLDSYKALHDDGSIKANQRDLEAMTAAEREKVFGNRYSADGFVASDTFKAPLAPGETYADRAQAVLDAMKGTVADSYRLGSDLSKKNTEAQNFEIWRKENPEQFESWFNSLEAAFGNSDIDALTELQKMAAPGENGEPSKLSMLPPEYRARLQKAGEEATWNAVKDNPLNINKAIGLWLRQNGHGGMADFVSDSVLFYGSLAGLLAGGVVLGGMFGGGDDDDDDDDRGGYQVGGPRYNPQEPAGYNRIPYT